MIMMNIDLEGLDGSGKSTQAKLLSEYYRLKEARVRLLHFPTVDDEYIGRVVKHYLGGKYGSALETNPEVMAMVYATDRKMISSKMYTWATYKYVLVLDRYVESNCAYQGAKLDSIDDRLEFRHWVRSFEYEFYKSPKPDLAFYLDVPLDIIEKRLKETREPWSW
ncbi:hypothetical protein EOM86_07500 [Candidatus Nomurabacteria bacterium]|nr:hypothetical protein [Candidatus Nomurabacteria bacterium]